jgi:hypothetical protein
MNEVKTKAMIVEGAKAPKMQSRAAFDRRHKGEGESHLERISEKVQCELWCDVAETEPEAASVKETL